MANVLTGRQWSVDTAALLTPLPVKIGTIIFTGLVAGDTAVLTDAAGRPVWNGLIGTELEAENSPKIGWAQGLRLVSITNGSLIIYTE